MLAAVDISTASGRSSPLSSLLSSPLSSAPSSPLSSPASSPSPPPDMALPPPARARPALSYPSPPASQQTSQSGSPAPDGMDSSNTTDKEGPPPAKRRRISKERTTEYLDMRHGEVDRDQIPELDRVMNVLHKRQKIVVIAGAGISVSADSKSCYNSVCPCRIANGVVVPDFRSKNGLFRSLKEEHKLKGSGKDLFDASVYKDDTSTSSFHQMVSEMSRLTKHAKPTPFHHMLATIAQEDRLLRLYSQNVDGLDTGLEPLRTRTPLRKDEDGKWPRTVQLHGGLDKMVCSKCNDITEFDADLFDGAVPPPCPRCEEINDIRTTHEGKRSHGIGRLRPRMVLYNEHNPDDEAIGTVTRQDLQKRPDAVVVVGTTLKVPGVRRIVREMCGVVRDRRGGVAIWINQDLPPVAKDLEDCFDIVVQGPCDAIAQQAAMRKYWEPAEEADYAEVSDADARRAARKSAEVHLTKSTVSHLEAVALPSARHVNNTFPATNSESGSRTERSSPVLSGDWSPFTSRNSSIVDSIERNESVNVDNGLLTPSKPSKHLPIKAPNLADKLMDASKTKSKPPKPGKPSKAPPKKKQSNVKYVKPHATATKGKQQPKKTAGPKQGGLTTAFKTTKTAAVEARSAAAKDKVVPTSPSKLRQVANAEQHVLAKPMHAVSPNTSPSKSSPIKKRAFFPGLSQAENVAADESKKREIGEVS